MLSMSFSDDDEVSNPEPQLDAGVRFWLIILCIGCLLFAGGTAPLFLAMLAMSFDAPGSQWEPLHFFWIGLPTLIFALGIAAGWSVAKRRLKALWIVLVLLVIDVVGLGLLWPQA